jgi:uncharacterized protein (DUF608 family)
MKNRLVQFSAAALLAASGLCFAADPAVENTLFPTNLPERQWSQFKALGFTGQVCGTIYNSNRKPECGVPLGGIGTGCLDLEADGTFGYCTAFSRVWGHGDGEDGSRIYRDRNVGPDGVIVDLNDPTRGPIKAPFLGLAVEDKVWILTTVPTGEGLHKPDRIDYWGHYPVVDMEFQSGGPVNVGMRAWTPFILGDTIRSNVPAAVFEVHLRNTSTQEQRATLAMNFPGPRERERQGQTYVRQVVNTNRISGVAVSTPANLGYVLAAMETEGVRSGLGLGENWAAWSHIAGMFPQSIDPKASSDGSVSVAVDCQLAPNATKVVRFVLAWYAPTWQSDWPWANKSDSFTQMYTTRFGGPLDVANYIAENHTSLLASVLDWQQAIYADKSIPGWLADGLVNILHLIAEESYWARALPPIGNVPKPEEGVFSLVEGTDAGGQQSCIPCDWYGNLPIVYFFPDLARNTLRAYTYGMSPDGAVPMTLGVRLSLMTGQYQYDYQKTLNPCCYVDLVDRLWLRTSDDSVLEEFYPSVKKTTQYVVNLIPTREGIVSNAGQEWYEGMGIIGMSSHIAGVRLAHFEMAERMAKKMGDEEFAEQCHLWREQASDLLESRLWGGTHYLLFDDPTSQTKSNLILAYQLDGEWMADLHGVASVFQKDRIIQTLKTIKDRNGSVTECGLINVVQPEGKITDFGGRMGRYCTMPASVFITAMNYIYEGDRETGMEIARQCLNNLVNTQGMTWDMPNMVRGDKGNMRRIYGFDYYQCMSLWGLPAALKSQDLKNFSQASEMVERILKAQKQS